MEARQRALAVVSATLLLSVLVWFNYSALLPLIVEDWGLSGVEAGVVFAAFQAGYVLAILPAGRLADVYSTRRVVAVGAVGTGVASIGFAALADGIYAGTALRFLAGVCMAGVYVPGMRFLSDWYPSARRGRAMGVYVGAYSLSTGLSFLLSSTVAAAVDWRVGIAATSVGALVAGPLMLVGTRDPPDASPAGVRFDRSLLRNRTYRYAVGVYAGHAWEVFGVRNWMQAFLVAAPAIAATGNPTVTAGLITGTMLSLGGLGNLLGGWASDRFGRASTVAAALGASALLSLGMGLFDGLSIPLLVGLVCVYGVVLVADSSPTSTVVTEVVDDRNVGVALAFQSLVGFGATAISPVVFGAALDAGGYELAFPTLAAGALVGLASLAALARAAPDGAAVVAGD
ncbi:MAG: MFS transporter [Haloplanus sp.]